MTLARLACAGLVAAALAAPAFADPDRVPGAYRAESGETACHLRLDPPARAPEDSLITPETVSGLVLAFPGCPAGLSDALLWRAPSDGSSLQLIDGAGAVILEARPGEARGWTGETEAGEAVTLTPS